MCLFSPRCSIKQTHVYGGSGSGSVDRESASSACGTHRGSTLVWLPVDLVPTRPRLPTRRLPPFSFAGCVRRLGSGSGSLCLYGCKPGQGSPNRGVDPSVSGCKPEQRFSKPKAERSWVSSILGLRTSEMGGGGGAFPGVPAASLLLESRHPWRLPSGSGAAASIPCAPKRCATCSAAGRRPRSHAAGDGEVRSTEAR